MPDFFKQNRIIGGCVIGHHDLLILIIQRRHVWVSLSRSLAKLAWGSGHVTVCNQQYRIQQQILPWNLANKKPRKCQNIPISYFGAVHCLRFHSKWFNHCAASVDTQCTHLLNFSNLTTRGWVIDDSTNFPDLVFGWGDNIVQASSQSCVNQIIHFETIGSLKSDWVAEIDAIFNFSAMYKVGENWAKYLSQGF